MSSYSLSFAIYNHTSVRNIFLDDMYYVICSKLWYTLIFEDFTEKSTGFPSPHSANTRLSPGNLGAFSDFFQNSTEKWPKMNKNWFLGYRNTFSIRLCKQKLILSSKRQKVKFLCFSWETPGFVFMTPALY